MSRSKQKVYIYKVLTKESRKDGRPEKYDSNFHPQAAQEIMALGSTIRKLARIFQVHRDTIYEWKRQYIEFSDAIKVGKDMFNGKLMEQALNKKALGFTFDEKTYEMPQIAVYVVGGDKKTKADTRAEVENQIKSMDLEPVMTKRVRKYYPPDTNAIKFYLNNRDNERWPKNGDLPGDGALVYMTANDVRKLLDDEQDIIKRIPKPQTKRKDKSNAKTKKS